MIDIVDRLERIAGKKSPLDRDRDLMLDAARAIRQLRADLVALHRDYITANTGLLDCHRECRRLRTQLKREKP